MYAQRFLSCLFIKPSSSCFYAHSHSLLSMPASWTSSKCWNWEENDLPLQDREYNMQCTHVCYALKGSVASQTIHIRTYGYNYKEYSEFSFLTWSIVFADNGIRANMIKSFEHGVQLSPWNEPIFGISCFLSSLLMMNTSITIRCWYK